MQITLRQQLALLLIAGMAMQMSHGFLFDMKEGKEALKKLDILNLFTEKEEKKENELEKIKQWFVEKEEKKIEEWEKIKQWFDEKKLNELKFFEAIKEKEIEKLEEKLQVKTSKKLKPKLSATTECYKELEYTTKPTYPAEQYQEEEEEQYQEEAQEKETLLQLPKKEAPCPCKANTGYSAYDVREDLDDGIRYFT